MAVITRTKGDLPPFERAGSGRPLVARAPGRPDDLTLSSLLGGPYRTFILRLPRRRRFGFVQSPECRMNVRWIDACITVRRTRTCMVTVCHFLERNSYGTNE